MKVKIGEVVDSIESLNKLMETKLPSKVGYWINRISKKLAPEIETYNESRGKLFKEYGEEDPETKIIKIKPENIDTFKTQIEELNKTEITLENIDKLKIEDLNNIVIEPKYLPDWLFE